VPKQSPAEKVAYGSCRRRVSMVGFRFVFFERPNSSLFRDRRKLTFYFVADKRIDFRELVRELFRCVLGPCYWITRHSPTCKGCTKRGSGWHPCRVLLAMNSDHVSSSHDSSLHCFIFSPPVLLLPYLSLSNHCMLYVLALNRSVRIKMSCDVIFHTSDHFLWHIPTFECLALYASYFVLGSHWCRVHMFV
jgi:hypothetical protein